MEDQRTGILALIQRLSREEEGISSQAMQDLKRDYNSTVEGIYHNTHGGLQDIIEVFPPEIWIRIIQDSLPVQNYPSALLLLTAVSSRWQRAITATPLLWSHIQISGLDEDALATIQAFAHLSRNTALLLTINVPLYYEPAIFNSILADLSTRLHRVVVRADSRVLGGGYTAEFRDAHIASGISILLESPQYCSGVVEVDVQHEWVNHVIHGDTTLDALFSLLPRGLRAIHGWCFCAPELRASSEALEHLEKIQTCMPLEDSMHHLEFMPRVRTLLMTEEQKTSTGRRRTMAKASVLFNLAKVSINQTDRPALAKLIESTGTSLLDLELKMAHIQCIDLLEILRITTRLTRLSLRLIQSDVRGNERRGLFRPLIRPGETIPSLRILELSADTVDFTQDEAVVLERAIRHQLLLTIASLYKGVEEAVISFNFVEGHVSLFWKYLSRLPHLRQLRLRDLGWVSASEEHVVILPALEELDTIASEPLRYLQAPRLLSLKLPWDDVCGDIGAFTYEPVRTLHIKYDDLETPRILFLPGNLPAVTTLEIRAYGYAALQPGPLQFLTTISIAAMLDTPIASSLCIELLYRPEDCPALFNIKVAGFGPELDILFMMLERRNFLINGRVSRIRRITLPYVPDELRTPLAYLLRGIYTPRPSNEDLSFVTLMEAFFDDQISGCRTCLRNRMHCNERGYFTPGVRLRRVRNSIYSTAKNPPPFDMDPETLDWIRWRETHILKWKAAVSQFGRAYWRVASCNKQGQIAPMEITEHGA